MSRVLVLLIGLTLGALAGYATLAAPLVAAS